MLCFMDSTDVKYAFWGGFNSVFLSKEPYPSGFRWYIMALWKIDCKEKRNSALFLFPPCATKKNGGDHKYGKQKMKLEVHS